MDEYHKILTVFERDEATKYRTLKEGVWACPEFGYLANTFWTFTEKVDGTNIRVMIGRGDLDYGGRTNNAQIPAPLINSLNDKFLPLRPKLTEIFPDTACLYGEGYGAKIQKGGGNYRPDQSFVLFDVRVGDWWLKRPNVEDVASKLGLDVVPIIGQGPLENAVDMAREGFNSRWGDFRAEGVVMRPAVELLARNGKRIIAKIKCKDFA